VEPLHLLSTLSFSTFDLRGRLIGQARSQNLIVNTGITSMGQLIAWGLFQNQNSAFGGALNSAWGNFGNVYGAVGIGSGSQQPSDTSLALEIWRTTCSSGSLGSGQITAYFQFGTAQANGRITEGGLFTTANLVTTTLTSALTSGTQYTSLAVNALPAQIPGGSTITIGYTTSQIQQVTTSATAASGATSISVNAFTANANYGVGATVAYLPGLMLNHVFFLGPVTKNSSMTGTLQWQLTLLSQ
jgi:hypothetical protein